MAERFRCFLAVNLPDDLKRTVGGFIDSLRAEVRGVRWVRGENLHLTLKFLGDVESGIIPDIGKALDGVASDVGPIPVTLCGAGVFPPRGRPRVVWLDLTRGGDELAALQRRCEGVLAPLGFPPEERPFTPHLTIGRVKDLRSPIPLGDALAEASSRNWGDFVVERVHLMRSELFPTGPRYSILHAVRLTPS